MAGTGPKSCPIVGFGISVAETSGSDTRDLIINSLDLRDIQGVSRL